MADDEEARILATINKKQNSAFEQRRREALKHAQGDAAKNFHLAEEEKKTKRDSVDTPVFAKPLSSDSNSSSNNTYVSASRGLLTDEEKARLERENAGHGDLYAYQEEQMRQEREFRKNRDEDDKKKQDYISSLGAAGLAKYQESIEERERELKRKMAEGEKK